MVTTMAKLSYPSSIFQQDSITSQLHLHSTHPHYMAASSAAVPTPSILGQLVSIGFRVGFNSSGLHSAKNNLQSAVEHPTVIDDYLYNDMSQAFEVTPTLMQQDSNDLYQANLIDNFYPNRPASLGHVCLYDFVKWYRRGDNDAEGRRQYVRAGKPKIPNHRIYDPNKPDEREPYFYSLLLLFVPFTDESELVGDGQTAEAFNEHFRDHSSMEHYHESLQKYFKHKQRCEELKEEEVPADEDAAVEDEGIKIIGEADAAMHDIHDMDYDTTDLSERIGMLNKDQRRIFEQVVDHLHHQRRHEMIANAEILSHRTCLSVESEELESHF